MKKKKLLTLAILLAFAWIAQSCHTYVFENVKSKMLGRWTLIPASAGNLIEFEFFDNDSLTVYFNGAVKQLKTQDGKLVNKIGYNIQNRVSNHYIIFDKAELPDMGTRARIFLNPKEYLIINVDKEGMALESIGEDKSLKGEYQLEFFKSR